MGDTSTMRALRLTAPGPRNLLIEVGAVGSCRSGPHMLEPEFPLPHPLTVGHGVAAAVAAVGSAVDGIAEGERALRYLRWSGGVCRECVCGNENMCRAAGRTAFDRLARGEISTAAWR